MARMDDGAAARLVVHADRRLAEQLRDLGGQRMVFFAGLPGKSKSLLVHQLAHLASGAGRRIHLLQWDVARPVFEASPAGRRYPLADGVTHGPGAPGAGYDPLVYRRVYEKVLRDRHVEVVAPGVILPTEKLSVYDFAIAPLDLIPTDAEAEEFIREVERCYPDPTVLESEIAHWWKV